MERTCISVFSLISASLRALTILSSVCLLLHRFTGKVYCTAYLACARLVPADYSSTNATVSLPELTRSSGRFQPLVPSLLRLFAGILVLVVLESIVLGFPGLSQTIPSSTITISSLFILLVGFVASIIVFKYGTQLSSAAGDAYNAFKNYEELAVLVFLIAALYISYITSRTLVTASGIFTGLPWAYPMIFVIIGLVSTVKVVINTIHTIEG